MTTTKTLTNINTMAITVVNTMTMGNDDDLPAGFEMKMETMKKTREAANQR